MEACTVRRLSLIKQHDITLLMRSGRIHNMMILLYTRKKNMSFNRGVTFNSWV